MAAVHHRNWEKWAKEAYDKNKDVQDQELKKGPDLKLRFLLTEKGC